MVSPGRLVKRVLEASEGPLDLRVPQELLVV